MISLETMNSEKELIDRKIDSFSLLEKGWDSYDSDKISINSIITAHDVLEKIVLEHNIVNIEVFPMRNGGIQFEIGDNLEIEIDGNNAMSIVYDENFNVTSKNLFNF